MLTDEEKREIWDSIPNNYTNWYEYANAIERAVLAKAMPIPKQEPVGFVYRDENAKGCKLKASLDILGEEKVKLGDKLYLKPQPAQAAIPNGYCLAPKEPTASMLDAGVAMALQVSVHGEGGWSKYLRGLYKQMLSASPKPE